MTDRDLLIHKGLIKILDDATFQLKAREVAAFLEVYKWVKELPEKFKEPVIEKVKK